MVRQPFVLGCSPVPLRTLESFRIIFSSSLRQGLESQA